MAEMKKPDLVEIDVPLNPLDRKEDRKSVV